MEPIIIILIVALFVLFKIMMPSIKGKLGESKVSAMLSFLPHDKYKVIDNVFIKSGDRSVQIDHIVVSIYGIFVIETKNYKGWITGFEYSEQWTKNMYGKKYSFYNPIRQNRSHINALRKVLGFSEDKFIPIIAFSGASDLKVNTTTPVIYISQINQKIKTYTSPKFNADDLNNIVKQIISISAESNVSKQEHIKNIKTSISIKESKIASGICPYCQSRLVERNGKYGNFIGCTNYPRCKFTKR